ncbi:MAG: hypothetical protein QG657_4477 [Acidobacteriota bacterium]|nr:hypothetical protein [Acidobacteriota bacterium]
MGKMKSNPHFFPFVGPYRNGEIRCIISYFMERFIPPHAQFNIFTLL